MKTFGIKLKELREQYKVTQNDLANYLNVGRPTIAGYETKGKQPDYDKLIKISKFFNVSIDYLIGNDLKLNTLHDNKNTYTTNKNIKTNNIKLADEIIKLLVKKQILSKEKQITNDQIKWLIKLLDKAIDISLIKIENRVGGK